MSLHVLTYDVNILTRISNSIVRKDKSPNPKQQLTGIPSVKYTT
jgi:hypothetical protein